jgi:LDH2 family malate/lactate/ureidoglycolate dehydrogenase
MRETIHRAKMHGPGVIALRNSSHVGAAMHHTLMGAAEGCVGFLSTSVSPAMAPWGLVQKPIGTNP